MTSTRLFWDTRVFVPYLTNDTDSPHLDDIIRYVEEAKQGKWTIHFSTITYAEIRQEYFKPNDYGNIAAFFADLGANFIPVEPNPNILIQTGELRSAQSTNPGDLNPPRQRAIATPDAIIMVSALFVRDALGVSDIVLQSTDQGKGKSWAGRCIPVVGFERWYPESTRTPMITRVCGLPKRLPEHPEPTFKGVVVNGRFPKSGTGSKAGAPP